MSRKINFVSKATDGVYTVTIKGNTMKVSDEEGNIGTKVFPDNEKFDVGKGFWNCFKQIKKAKKSLNPYDEVKIVDMNEVYDDYWQWFDNIDMVKGFSLFEKPDPNKTYVVAKVAPHKTYPNKTLVAISDGFGAYYLIGYEGLKKV